MLCASMTEVVCARLWELQQIWETIKSCRNSWSSPELSCTGTLLNNLYPYPMRCALHHQSATCSQAAAFQCSTSLNANTKLPAHMMCPWPLNSKACRPLEYTSALKTRLPKARGGTAPCNPHAVSAKTTALALQLLWSSDTDSTDLPSGTLGRQGVQEARQNWCCGGPRAPSCYKTPGTEGDTTWTHAMIR